MSNKTLVNLEKWVEQKSADPVTYLQRQATEILLATVAAIPILHSNLYLKGGVLMSVLYQSQRQTSDVDFTAEMEPSDETAKEIVDALNSQFEMTAIKLGYTDIVCHIQGYKNKPKHISLEEGETPAIKAKLAFSVVNSRQHERLKKGNCPDVIDIDISFREPVDTIQIVSLNTDESEIKAYSLIDVLAEKYRAILQQPIRNRIRRQDVYDVSHLITNFPLGVNEKKHLLKTLTMKCEARDFSPLKEGMADTKVRERSEAEWHTLRAELGGHLPDFNPTYDKVQSYYESLPW